MNFLHITRATHAGAHRLHLEFNDGASGTVDLSEELHGPVFEALRDIDYFRQFSLVGATIEWPNGADFAPEYLHSLLASASHPLTAA